MSEVKRRGRNEAPDGGRAQTHQETVQHHHPAPASIWRLVVLDLLLLLLLGGYGIFPEQVHGCPGFTGGEKKNKKKNKERVINMQRRLSLSQGIMRDLPK